MLLAKRLKPTNAIFDYHKPIFMSVIFFPFSLFLYHCQNQRTWHLNLIYVVRQHEFSSSFHKYALTLETIAEIMVSFAVFSLSRCCKKRAHERWRWQL